MVDRQADINWASCACVCFCVWVVTAAFFFTHCVSQRDALQLPSSGHGIKKKWEKKQTKKKHLMWDDGRD